MAMAIDRQALIDLIIDAKRTDPETGSFTEWLADYLIKHLSTLTQPNEWVSVEERLPPLRENVLVCAYWHEHWGVYMGWNSGHGWTVSCGIGQRSDVQVSHWIPLPAPPDRRPPEGEEDI